MNTSGKPTDDLSGLASFDQLYFPHPWTTDQWLELNLSHHFLYRWGIKDLQGFSLFHRVGDDETAHLLKICLHPERRGSGEALHFWQEIINDLRSKSVKSIYLEVELTNLRAIGFYRKLGFQTLRVIKGFYSSGGDALTMQLML